MGQCATDVDCPAEGRAAAGLVIGVLVLGAILVVGCVCCSRCKIRVDRA